MTVHAYMHHFYLVLLKYMTFFLALILVVNPLTHKDFYVFEWFSAYTCPIGFRDSIFKVTMESAAVLKH